MATLYNADALWHHIKLDAGAHHDNPALRAIDQAGMGFCRWNFTHRTLELSKGAHALLGFAHSPLPPNYLEQVYPEDRDALSRYLQAIGNGASQAPFLHRIKRVDGQRIWLELNAHINSNEQGDTEVLGILRDCTEQQLREKALRSSRHHFSSLFHLSPNVMLLISYDDGTIVSANKNVTRVFGWESEEVMGRTTIDLNVWVHPEEREKMRLKARESITPLTQQVWVRTRSGKAIEGLLSMQLIELDSQEMLLCSFVESTDLQRTEQALKNSEAIRSLAFDSSPDAIVITEKETGRYIEVNRSFREQTGFSDAEVIGKTASELGIWAHPSDRKRVIEHSLTQRTPVTVQFNNKYQNRLTTHLMFGAEIELDGIPCLVLTIRNITRQLQQEAALEQSEQRLQLAMDAANLGNWDWDMVRDRLYGSKRSSLIHGLANESFQGSFNEFYSTLGPTEQTRIFATFQEALKGLTDSFKVSYQITRPDGSQRDIESVAKLYRDKTGKAVRMTGTVRDITEDVQREQALRLSNDKYATLFQSSPDAICLTRLRDGAFIEVNPSFCKTFNWKAGDLIGHSSAEIGFWAEPNVRLVFFEKIRKTGCLDNEEALFYTRDRRLVTCIFSSRLIRINGDLCQATTIRDITEQRESARALEVAQNQIRHLAYHDALTNLPNRLLLMERLNQHIAYNLKNARTGALLFIDLDHFKHINDSLGHSVGDAVLKMISARLEACARPGDTLARLGGDEFVVLLDGFSEEREQAHKEILHIAQHVRALLCAPMLIERFNLQVSPSIGVALIPDHGHTPEDILKRADIALYRAKDAGRNTVEFFQASMQQAASERLRLEHDLRSALAHDEFELHLQPQVNALTRSIIGAEALLRWQHPERGYQSPAEFIHVLEETGMIVDVGHFIMRKACEMYAELQHRCGVTPETFKLCVNISPRQFRDPEFASQVAQCLAQSGISGSAIKLEITEGIVIDNLEATIAKMLELKQLGIGFAMDDFGTGYSSLTYLKRLPIDTIKIDQSFIRDCTEDQNDTAITCAIIAMSQSLQLETIAEGVETQEQLAFLHNQACYQYQGYFFSRPLPIKAFIQLINQ